MIMNILCGRKATLNVERFRAQELCESRGGRPGLPVPNSPYGLCWRKVTFEELEVSIRRYRAVLSVPL